MCGYCIYYPNKKSMSDDLYGIYKVLFAYERVNIVGKMDTCIKWLILLVLFSVFLTVIGVNYYRVRLLDDTVFHKLMNDVENDKSITLPRTHSIT